MNLGFLVLHLSQIVRKKLTANIFLQFLSRFFPSLKQYLQNDGTFETISQMIFTATRFENGASIRCEADNIVMREDGDRPLHDTLVLEVMCEYFPANSSKLLKVLLMLLK